MAKILMVLFFLSPPAIAQISEHDVRQDSKIERLDEKMDNYILTDAKLTVKELSEIKTTVNIITGILAVIGLAVLSSFIGKAMSYISQKKNG